MLSLRWLAVLGREPAPSALCVRVLGGLREHHQLILLDGSINSGHGATLAEAQQLRERLAWIVVDGTSHYLPLGNGNDRRQYSEPVWKPVRRARHPPVSTRILQPHPTWFTVAEAWSAHPPPVFMNQHHAERIQFAVLSEQSGPARASIRVRPMR